MKRNVFVFALLGTTALAGVLWAADTDIEVSARLRQGLTFANQVNMNFTPSSQKIDFFGTPAGTDHVNMGTDGVQTVDGSAFVPTALSGTPGSVDIVGDSTSAVDISCETSAVMSETVSGTDITVNNLQLSMNTGSSYNDTTPDYMCAGLGTTPLSHTLDGTDTILMGGRIVGNSNIKSQVYSTTNTSDGGSPATVRVVYQ